MPRTRKQPTTPPPEATAVLASAARLSAGSAKGAPKKSTQDWQEQAWHFVDSCGEFAFAAQWKANALSRVTLHVEKYDPATGEWGRIDQGPAVVALNALFGGESGQEQMMHALGFSLFAPGEAYLVGVVDPKPGVDQWRVLSNDEVKQTGKVWEIDRGDGLVERYRENDPDDPTSRPEVLVFRIWRPHPRKGIEATSPARAALPILRELEGLTAHIGASIDSRLAGAGLFLIPSEMTFASPNPGQTAGDPEADDFLVALVEAMEAAKRDRTSAAALAPIVLRVPGQLIEKVQHITFATPFSGEAKELREETIRRLALSLDMPPEILLGQADSNHWSAWLISEDALKVHIEPDVSIITHALTTQYLWPALSTADDPAADPEVRMYQIVGDTSALRLRPQRTNEAMTLHEREVITNAALARETGFDDTDLLDPASDEARTRMLQKVALSVQTPDLAAAALDALGVNLIPAPSTVEGDTAETVVGESIGVAAPTSPAAIEAPREIPAAVAAAIHDDPLVQMRVRGLLAAADAVCTRAMERSNSRLGNRGKNRRKIEDHEALTASLHDAWERVPIIAELHDVDPDALTAACSLYVRGRLVTCEDHDPQRLLHYIVTQPGLVTPGG